MPPYPAILPCINTIHKVNVLRYQNLSLFFSWHSPRQTIRRTEHAPAKLRIWVFLQNRKLPRPPDEVCFHFFSIEIQIISIYNPRCCQVVATNFFSFFILIFPWNFVGWYYITTIFTMRGCYIVATQIEGCCYIIAMIFEHHYLLHQMFIKSNFIVFKNIEASSPKKT